METQRVWWWAWPTALPTAYSKGAAGSNGVSCVKKEGILPPSHRRRPLAPLLCSSSVRRRVFLTDVKKCEWRFEEGAWGVQLHGEDPTDTPAVKNLFFSHADDGRNHFLFVEKSGRAALLSVALACVWCCCVLACLTQALSEPFFFLVLMFELMEGFLPEPRLQQALSGSEGTERQRSSSDFLSLWTSRAYTDLNYQPARTKFFSRDVKRSLNCLQLIPLIQTCWSNVRQPDEITEFQSLW